MPFTSRLDLRASVRNWLALTTELADAVVDDFIDLAEADINRRLRVLDRQETTTLAINASTVEVPSDFRSVVDLYLDVTPRRRLRLATEEQVRVLQAVRATGQPRLFAVKGSTAAVNEGKVFVFGPAPDTLYSGELTYWKSFTIDATGGAALMQRWPDVWLYGALTHAGDYLADARKSQWAMMYLEAINEIINEDQESRYGQPEEQG